MEKMKITWIGHTSVSIEFNDRVIYFAPWLDDNPVSKLKTSQVEKADAICVTLTHGYIDHIGDSLQLVRQTWTKLICTPELWFYDEPESLKEDEQVKRIWLVVGTATPNGKDWTRFSHQDDEVMTTGMATQK